MKIINLIWGFTLGAGIDKCYLTYAKLGEIDSSIEMKNVCIDIQCLNSHTEPLKEIGVTFISIKNRRDLSWVKKLNNLLKEEQADAVFTHGFNGAIMMMIERLFCGNKTKLICSYHGAYHAPTLLKKIVEPIYNSLPIFIYKHYAHRVICVANSSNNYLVEKGVLSNKTVTVHNGIKDTNETRCLKLPNHIDNAVTLLTASRISGEKGLPYLLKALSMIKKQNVKFHYYMVGEGPDLEMLKKQIQVLELTDLVSTVGFQDNVTQWMASCDIFVLPSLHENHSIAVLEAMRAGKPIVATEVGGNGESIENNHSGLLVPSKDEKALADALYKLITDEELRKALGKNARKRFLKLFTEEVMQHNLIKALKS